MKKTILFIGIILFSILNADVSFAQNDLLNSKKYWYYRWRLTNDFMVVGDCQGCSLPASERYGVPWSHSLKWSDGMIMMGQYLGMLATEYKLLSSHGQSTLKTRKELYYALRAINRVDEAAEPYIQIQDPSLPTCPSSLNGFFLRDDVPATFVQDHFDHFNQYKTSEPHIDYTGEYDYDSIYTDTAYITNTESDYSHSLATGNNNFFAEMSLDQAVSILVGLSLINEFVDQSANYRGENDNESPWTFQDNETSILEENKAIALRIGNWLATHFFIVQRPCTNDNVHIGCCGGVVWQWAIAKVIADITQDPAFIILSNPISTSYGIWKDDACAFHAWDPGVQSDPGSYYIGKFMVLELMAAGADIYPLTSINQYDCVNGRTYLALNCDDPMPYKTEWMPLMHSIVNNYTLNNNLWPQRYQDYLNSAPCTGPFLGTVNFGYPNNPEWNWSTTSLLYRPEHRINYWETGAPFAEFNGIDYMLLYNLYRIRAEMDGYTVGASYYDMIDPLWDLNFPITIGSNSYGSHASPIQQDGFNTFKANNTISNDGNVTYRAGYEIALLNNFSVATGADFHAYIDPFDCDRTVDNEYRNQEYSSALETLQNTSAQNSTKDIGIQHNESNSSITPLVHNELNSNFSVFPNPNNGQFEIESSKAIYNVSIEVFDVLGNSVYKKQFEVLQKEEIDITSISSGIYYVRITNKSGTNETRKIAKE